MSVDLQTLWTAKLNKKYSIENVLIENNTARRLEALGINEGTPVYPLTRKKSGAMVIKVRGTRLAIGKNISTNIEVKEVINE